MDRLYLHVCGIVWYGMAFIWWLERKRSQREMGLWGSFCYDEQLQYEDEEDTLDESVTISVQ